MSAPDTKEAEPRANVERPKSLRLYDGFFSKGEVTLAHQNADCKRIEQAFDRIDFLCNRILSKLEGAR